MQELEERERQLVKNIKASMVPLLAEARRSNMLLASNTSKEMLFTPDELEKAQSEGRFLWGCINWRLVDIMELRKSLEEDVIDAIARLRMFDSKHGINQDKLK